MNTKESGRQFLSKIGQLSFHDLQTKESPEMSTCLWKLFLGNSEVCTEIKSETNRRKKSKENNLRWKHPSPSYNFCCRKSDSSQKRHETPYSVVQNMFQVISVVYHEFISCTSWNMNKPEKNPHQKVYSFLLRTIVCQTFGFLVWKKNRNWLLRYFF